MTPDLIPTQILAGVGALLVLLIVWRFSVDKARRAADVARAGTRVVSLIGRVLVMAAVMVGVQWLVITKAADNVTLLIVVLALPDLIAANVLTRALIVTSIDTATPPRRGGRR